MSDPLPKLLKWFCLDEKPSELRIEKSFEFPFLPSYGCCTRVNFVLKKHLLFQMNLSNSGLKKRSIKENWLIFTILKFPLGLQFSHNLTKFKIIKYISTIYIMTTTCTYLQQLTQVSDVALGPLVLFPFTVPCRIVFAKPEDLETWPNHLSFRFFTRVRSSSYSPMAAWIFLRTSSLVTWSLYEMFNSPPVASHLKSLRSFL